MKVRCRHRRGQTATKTTTAKKEKKGRETGRQTNRSAPLANHFRDTSGTLVADLVAVLALFALIVDQLLVQARPTYAAESAAAANLALTSAHAQPLQVHTSTHSQWAKWASRRAPVKSRILQSDDSLAGCCCCCCRRFCDAVLKVYPRTNGQISATVAYLICPFTNLANQIGNWLLIKLPKLFNASTLEQEMLKK